MYNTIEQQRERQNKTRTLKGVYNMNKERMLNLKMKDLPPFCYGANVSEREIIIIKKYETGYFLTDYGTFEDMEEMQKVVNKLNEQLGVSEEQAHLMKIKSMCGNWKD